ncbi:unnamed protein product [Penicillium salamii]|nr:unnamed protein product [Penicillium salamii]CAG8237908.1 unnamed protein product [Penicillium salamii]CAG8355969.1 unnamed protein product [Penicillium salamii]
MSLLFQSSETQHEQKQTAWYTEYLLVMAMAKLMDVEQHTSQPPGSELFTEALGRLPPLHLLNDGGVLMVEILTLIATYLQWCDQKIDAYMHIGIALRLSIALGCNLPENEQTCLSSQGTHRLRLWWTVYMLDRRLSSSLGLAAGADERQLRVGLPRHAIGFQSPVALTINIRIARVTDNIMSCRLSDQHKRQFLFFSKVVLLIVISALYGNAAVAQVELVCKVQAILQELYDIGQAFPRSLSLDFSQPLQTVTRTGASLYLMLFQAIILCTRPMLLRRVRLEVRRQDESHPPEPDTLTRFCDTCIEAATRSLAILYILRLQRAIPRYGFFDLEATFSAAFIHIMAGFLNKPKEQPKSLGQAFEVLGFLARSGNPAAGKRLQDIAQSSLHIWPNHKFDIQASNQSVVEKDPDATERARCENLRPLQPSHFPQDIIPLSDGHSYGLDENEYSEPWDTLDPITPVFDMQGDLATHNPGEAEVIYSSFYNPTLPLTGVDYMDWLEIEKLLNAPAC